MDYEKDLHIIDDNFLSRELGIEPLTAKLLSLRGYDTVESAKSFLCPKLDDLSDFTLYSGVKDACYRIKEAIANGEKIVVYGDYDCDGVCASAILSETIKENGGDVEIYIPKRLKEGYGVSREALEKLAEEYFPDLIVTVDCGITSYDEVRYCIEELGIDVIVTDHHEPPSKLPECIVVNPHLDEGNGFCDYCGAGVAFMLVNAMYGINFSAKYLDVVAVATMGDVVPLRGDNRILVHYGLKKMEKSPCLGLKLMFESLGQKGRYTSSDVAFKIVPRINSLGRLGDAKRAISIFTETDYFVLNCLIKDMNDENQARRALCDKIESEAIECAKPFVNSAKILVLCGNWHQGVLGIVASRLTERFLRPTILFCYEDGLLKGSCRSIDTINIYELLTKFSHRFIRFGGHAQAAGITMDARELEIFREEITTYARDNYPDELFVPKFSYDSDITGLNVTRKFLAELERFEPFGEGNPEPIFHALEGEGKYRQSKNSIAHLTASTNRGYSVSAFFKGEYLPLLNSKATKHCYYTLGINIFNDKEYPQAVLKHVAVDGFDAIYNNPDEITTFSKTINLPQKEVQLFDKTDFYRIVVEIFKGDAYGGLVVCFTKETYDEIKSILDTNKIFPQTYYGANGKNSINAIVYCPSADFDYGVYENVLFADKPLSYPEEIGFDVYSVEYDCALLDSIKAIDLKRNKVGEHFKMLKSLLTSSSVRSVQSAISQLKLEKEAVEFTLSWQILREVGLLDVNGDGIFYIKNIRTELTNSPLYCIINQNG